LADRKAIRALVAQHFGFDLPELETMRVTELGHKQPASMVTGWRNGCTPKGGLTLARPGQWRTLLATADEVIE